VQEILFRVGEANKAAGHSGESTLNPDAVPAEPMEREWKVDSVGVAANARGVSHDRRVFQILGAS
jgi:hypothetical protein